MAGKLSAWSRFKNWISGMTDEERDLYRVQEREWHLQRILGWNAEIGTKYFNETAIRSELNQLKKQISAMKRRLPADSRMKIGPWAGAINENPYTELAAHIAYLRDILRLNSRNPRFPLSDTVVRLRTLENDMMIMQRANTPQVVVVQEYGPRRDWNPQPIQPWNPPVAPAVPITPPGFGPPPAWNPPVPVGPAVPIGPSLDVVPQGFGPPPGGAFGRGIRASRDPRTGRFVSQKRSYGMR